MESAFQVIGHEIDEIQHFSRSGQIHGGCVIDVRSGRDGQQRLFPGKRVQGLPDRAQRFREVFPVLRGGILEVAWNAGVFPVQIHPVIPMLFNQLCAACREAPAKARIAADRCEGVILTGVVHQGEQNPDFRIPSFSN